MSVVWLVGRPGAGKSTLAQTLRGVLRSVCPTLVLDGDAIAAALHDDQIRNEPMTVTGSHRLARLARLMASQGFVVVVADDCTDAKALAWNRDHLIDYQEVYLKATTERLAKRDIRGLYARALAGQSTGHEAFGEWREPRAPDLVLDMNDPEPPEVLALRVAMLIREFANATEIAARTTPNLLPFPRRGR